MIPVAPAAEPADFDPNVRQPGRAWLLTNPNNGRPPPYWSRCLTQLGAAFSQRCGYAAMLDATGGTVDHYRSTKVHRDLSYEWANYRFASSALNSSKKNADDAVLDPFEVQHGWFAILLPSLQMVVTDAVPDNYRAIAEYTLARLKLANGERVVGWRQAWYDLYRGGDITLAGLRRVAPLIAEAVERAKAAPGV